MCVVWRIVAKCVCAKAGRGLRKWLCAGMAMWRHISFEELGGAARRVCAPGTVGARAHQCCCKFQLCRQPHCN